MDSDPRPPLPPLPPMIGPLTPVGFTSGPPPATTSSSSSSPSHSLIASLFIIAAIIAAVAVASLCIHLLLRFISSRRSSFSSVSALPLPLVDLRSSSAPSAAESDDRANAAALIDTLPVFTFSSALASLPKSTPDCAVCLCPFRPDDELRLLPACRHAFHSSCVDPWIHTTPSCPLCRASISLPAPPLILPTDPPVTGDQSASRSGSFRIEIGNVSRRRTLSAEDPPIPPPPEPPPPPPHQRTYSIGSSFEYMVEEEVEAVVSQITRRMEKLEKRREESGSEAATAEPGDTVAAAAGRSGTGGWLKDYVDRLASSASSSFSSLRLSGRWSHRYDGDGGGIGRNSWDLEGSARREAEAGGYYGFYRWLIGA
ncbi:E3 ubiquitin-protein ligase ATL4-like [Curcuma longa]|uniref:E3 ubiquitin-protein ligase ATL4-like n=1 Tax=Curcuma longa TaxID=136217 RepID=UPI003D9F5C9C